MQAFSFKTPKSISVESGGAGKLGDRLGMAYSARNVLIVTDGGLHKLGLLETAKDSLRAAGFGVTVFDQVVADPPESVIFDCVAAGKAAGAEIVIGFGGGSSLDAAKLVAILLKGDQPLSGMFGIDNVAGDRTPLILVPTTAGTGSEVTNISIVTTGETTKMGVVSDQLYADEVLLDAELTIGLPASITAATGIDAMVHAIEAYTSAHKKNPLSDNLAREALRLLSSNIVTACENGRDRDAREAMLLGACLAGQAFANSPVAAVHALAYPLGGHYHIPHGLSNALMLLPVLNYNRSAAEDLYAELADVIAGEGEGDAATRCERMIAKVKELLDATNVPQRLRDVGVTKESLTVLASDAMLQTRLLQNNPVEIELQDALALYQEAY